MAKVKHGNYDLGPHDFDLQADQVEISPISGLASFSFVTGQLTAAKRKAIELLNVQLAGKIAGGNLTLSDFEPSKEALDVQTGKFIPVEWQALRSGSGHGERAGTWTILVDMDDVPPGIGAHGPDRPHVGYSYWFNAKNSAFNVSRVNGHVFVNFVPASRNSLSERDCT